MGTSQGRTQTEVLLHLQALVVMRRERQAAGDLTSMQVMQAEKEIRDIQAVLPKEVVLTYESLSRKYSDPVAAISDSRCAACRVPLPAEKLSHLALKGDVFTCRGCGRLLVA